jgi:hypothetical protein
MPGVEAKLEAACRKRAREVGGWLVKFVSPGHAGVPDRILILPGGSVWFLEFKRPGAKLGPLQERWKRRLADHNFRVIQSADEFEDVLRDTQIQTDARATRRD